MSKIQKHIQKHIKHIPYEGEEIDVQGLESKIEDFLKGMVNFAHKFEKTSKGYQKDGQYYSREEIVQLFILSI